MRGGNVDVLSEVANGCEKDVGIKCCATCRGYNDLNGYCDSMRRLVGYIGPCDQDIPVSVVAICNHWTEREEETVYRRGESG
jgi:hypothetical protein